MTNPRLAAFLIAAFALADCGGGGSHAPGSLPATGSAPTTTAGPDLSANAPHNAAPAAGAVAASVSIQIPLAKQTAATKRRPQYLTSYTQGVDLEAYQNGTYSGYVFYPVGTGQSNCTAVATALNCTLGVQAPAGAGQIIVHTYDGTTVASNMLSAGAGNATIASGQTNNVAVTTNPVVSQISATGQPTLCVTMGSSQTSTVTYTALDADGGALTGLTLANPFTLADVNPNDPSPGWTITPGTFTSGSGSFTFGYSGSDPNIDVVQYSVPFRETSTAPTSIIAAQLVPVATAPPHYVYMSDKANNQLNGFDFCASANANFQATGYGLPAGTNPLEVRYDRHSPAGDPRLFVRGSNGTVLWVDIGNSPANGPATVLQTLSLGAPVKGMTAPSGSVPSQLFVTYGTTSITAAAFSVNEGAHTITPASSNATLPSTAAGVGLNGVTSGALNEIFLSNGSAGNLLAINPSTMVLDATVSVGGANGDFSGPNSNASCQLATSSTSVSAISIEPAGSTTFPQIGSSIALSAPPQSETFFAPVTGTASPSSNTALVGQNGGSATLVSCDGVNLTQVATWPTFVTNATGMISSTFASSNVGSMVYVIGSNSGTLGANAGGSPWFAAYSPFSDQPVTYNNYSLGTEPPIPSVFTGVTAGP